MQRNEIITFGKYKGATIDEIHLKDPSYLIWADGHVENFNLNDYFYYKCIEYSQKIYNDTIMDVSFAEINGY